MSLIINLFLNVPVSINVVLMSNIAPKIRKVSTEELENRSENDLAIKASV